MPSNGFCRSNGPQSENERKQKIDKYLDFARELKKLFNMKVTVMRIVVGALETVPKVQEKTEATGDQM